MQLRKATNSDEEEVIRLYSPYQSDFPLDFSKSFANVVAEHNGKLAGFGWLDLIVEANIVLDLDGRPRDKFEALRGIVKYGENVVLTSGFKQMHIFPKSQGFVELLKKHLEFKEVTGGCLVKNLTHGQE